MMIAKKPGKKLNLPLLCFRVEIAFLLVERYIVLRGMLNAEGGHGNEVSEDPNVIGFSLLTFVSCLT